jgi:hypothetical protein
MFKSPWEKNCDRYADKNTHVAPKEVNPNSLAVLVLFSLQVGNLITKSTICWF